MTAGPSALIPVLYVEDLRASVDFYLLIGFEEVTAGDDGTWCYSYLRRGDVGLLVGANPDYRESERGPLQLYVQTDDVETIQGRLRAAGVAVDHLGHPDHAPGGEIRVLDPDRHVVMVGQTIGTAPPSTAGDDPADRHSILQRAAEATRRRIAEAHECEVGERGGARCAEAGQVKLTDSWGDTAWACLTHADEVVFTARGVYLASEDAEGLGTYLARRRRAR